MYISKIDEIQKAVIENCWGGLLTYLLADFTFLIDIENIRDLFHRADFCLRHFVILL